MSTCSLYRWSMPLSTSRDKIVCLLARSVPSLVVLWFIPCPSPSMFHVASWELQNSSMPSEPKHLVCELLVGSSSSQRQHIWPLPIPLVMTNHKSLQLFKDLKIQHRHKSLCSHTPENCQGICTKPCLEFSHHISLLRQQQHRKSIWKREASWCRYSYAPFLRGRDSFEVLFRVIWWKAARKFYSTIKYYSCINIDLFVTLILWYRVSEIFLLYVYFWFITLKSL